MMRTDQLVGIVRQHIDDGTEYFVEDETSILSVSDCVLWLTKGFLKRAKAEFIAQLKAKRNILCADYVDDPERAELQEFIDIYVAASIRQLLHFNSAMPGKPACLVSHHSDPRIAGVRSQGASYKVGYFGELTNARHRDELAATVDFIPVNTREPDEAWMGRLADYSLHYAIRQPQPFDGFKPFLKGFTAAACGAAIVVPLGESDAQYYLGREYPFVLQDESLSSVQEMLKFAAASFGGPEWRFAQTIMDSVRDRSSAEHVAGEFARFLSMVRE